MHENIKVPMMPGRTIDYPDKGQFVKGTAFTGLQQPVVSQTYYRGWHGYGKQVGIVVGIDLESNATLYPINSKGKPGPCYLVIPQDPEVIEDVAKELMRIANFFRTHLPKKTS